jgi:hypothetical protein
MEKVLKTFPASRWPSVQVGSMAIIGLFMFLVFAQSRWSLIAALMLILSWRACLSVYKEVRKQTHKATTDAERLDANWLLMQMTVAIISLLSLCIMLLRSGHSI